MSRKSLIAGNWKLNMNQAETQIFLASLTPDLNNKILEEVEVMVIPPFTSLDVAKTSIENSKLNIKLGAQDLSQFTSGAYTGEISAQMLLEIGVEYVLVGHSERREIFKEDDSIINAKLKTALAAGLKVVLCCGESEAIRESGKTDAWVENQIESALKTNSVDASRLVIAYEPIWAIGTGKTCDSTEANRVISVIRKKLSSLTNSETANQMRILYGGSVKASNATELNAQADIDGALVGGASLKKEEFLGIINANTSVTC